MDGSFQLVFDLLDTILSKVFLEPPEGVVGELVLYFIPDVSFLLLTVEVDKQFFKVLVQFLLLLDYFLREIEKTCSLVYLVDLAQRIFTDLSFLHPQNPFQTHVDHLWIVFQDGCYLLDGLDVDFLLSLFCDSESKGSLTHHIV